MVTGMLDPAQLLVAIISLGDIRTWKIRNSGSVVELRLSQWIG